jgi:hypothetical protein
MAYEIVTIDGVDYAVDDVGGKKLQPTKLDGGGDGVSVPITAGQKTMAGSLPFALASDQFTASGVVTETLINVATSSTPVLPANATRKGGWVRNISDSEIYVSFSTTATSGKPSLLSQGASLSLSGQGWVYTGAVAAIHAATGTKTLEVVEL